MTGQAAPNSGAQPQDREKVAKFVRIKVVDNTKNEHPTVNVRMPVGVVKFGMKMAKAFSPRVKDVDLDWDSLTAMIDEGAMGKILDVEDDAEHKTVEVWVE
jgi:hypothetical protein